jgi:hypothetical protein
MMNVIRVVSASYMLVTYIRVSLYFFDEKSLTAGKSNKIWLKIKYGNSPSISLPF